MTAQPIALSVAPVVLVAHHDGWYRLGRVICAVVEGNDLAVRASAVVDADPGGD